MSELGARYRAARGYAGLEQKDLAEKLGLERQSIRRNEDGERTPKVGERNAIAEICGVPRSFFDVGEELSFGPPGSIQRVERLLTEVRDALLGATSQSAADEAETKRRLAGLRHETEDPGQSRPARGQN